MHTYSTLAVFHKSLPVIALAQRQRSSHKSQRFWKSHQDVMQSLIHSQDKPPQELERPVLLVKKEIKNVGVSLWWLSIYVL